MRIPVVFCLHLTIYQGHSVPTFVLCHCFLCSNEGNSYLKWDESLIGSRPTNSLKLLPGSMYFQLQCVCVCVDRHWTRTAVILSEKMTNLISASGHIKDAGLGFASLSLSLSLCVFLRGLPVTKRKLNIHSACYHHCHSAVAGTFSKSAQIHRAVGKNIMRNKRTADTETRRTTSQNNFNV